MWENCTPARFCQRLLSRGRSVKSLNSGVFNSLITEIRSERESHSNAKLSESTSALVQQVTSTCLMRYVPLDREEALRDL